MKITKRQLQRIIKEELEDSMGQKVYLVVGFFLGSREQYPIGIFSTREEAQQGIIKDVEYEHQGGNTSAIEEDYRIKEFVLNRGRS